MHPGRFHDPQCPNSVLQFSLQRSLVVHTLIKFTPHPVGLFEQLKSQPPRLRHTLRRHLHPSFIQHIRRHLHPCAIRRGLIRNSCSRQLLGHLLNILAVETAEQHPPIWPSRKPNHPRTHRSQKHSGRNQPGPLPRRHCHQALAHCCSHRQGLRRRTAARHTSAGLTRSLHPRPANLSRLSHLASASLSISKTKNLKTACPSSAGKR